MVQWQVASEGGGWVGRLPWRRRNTSRHPYTINETYSMAVRRWYGPGWWRAANGLVMAMAADGGLEANSIIS